MQGKTENKPLTNKEERFCYEYLANGFNATKACIKAGYSQKTARSIGNHLLTKVDIKNRIQQMKDNLAETAGISALMIANEHAKIAFNSVAHLHNTWIERKELEDLTEEQKACIQEVSTKVLTKNIGTRDEPEIVDIEYVRIKTYDKQKSLEALADLLGYNAPKKTEVTGKDGKDLIPEQNTEKLKSELFEIVEKIKTASE